MGDHLREVKNSAKKVGGGTLLGRFTRQQIAPYRPCVIIAVTEDCTLLNTHLYVVQRQVLELRGLQEDLGFGVPQKEVQNWNDGCQSYNHIDPAWDARLTQRLSCPFWDARAAEGRQLSDLGRHRLL